MESQAVTYALKEDEALPSRRRNFRFPRRPEGSEVTPELIEATLLLQLPRTP